MLADLMSFTDVLDDEICDSQPISWPSSNISDSERPTDTIVGQVPSNRPDKRTGQHGQYRSIEEIDPKYRNVFSYPYFNLVQSNVIDDALYSDKSIVVCAPTGSGKTVVFEMAIVQLLMEIDDKHYTEDFKIIYMAPVKALCTERLSEWYPKFTKLGLLCIEVTGDTDVDFSQLKPYRIIITTPEKWDMLTRRWRDHKGLVEIIKLFLIDEVHILNDDTRGPVLEAVVSRMKTIESSAQSTHRIEQLQKKYQGNECYVEVIAPPKIRFVAVSATVSNPEDVANWLGSSDKPAVFHKYGDECRPVKLKRVVEGYPCQEGTSIFKFDIILNYKLWPIIQKYHDGKPTLIFCNTRKSVSLTAETLSRELTITFNPEQKAKLTALASTIKNKKLQSLVLSGVGCHHAGLLFEERTNIEHAFRNRDLPILITTTTLAMGVNLPAHLVIVKNTQQYVNGQYQEYSISTVLQMVGRAGRPQFDTEATAVIMTRLIDKPRYQALVGGSEPLQSYLHKRLAENLNSEAALGTVSDVAQCVQWLRSTFLYVRAARDPQRYLGLPSNAPQQQISKKIEELCVKAMNGLASSGLITMDEASCIESTEAGRLMSIFYLDLETMRHIMKINGTENLEELLRTVCESHELADMHLRVDERRCLNTLNRNNAAATIRFPMKGKISTRQMKLNCIIQAVLGCLPIPDPSLNQEAMKIMRIADRICKCLVTYVTRPDLIHQKPEFFSGVLNSLILAKCVAARLWENSQYVSKQLKGIGPTFSTLLATAGKVNFRLLEESNPRDLERIMNKGPPSGNVLRKQISLLPKYQLSSTRVDEHTVSIRLFLLNQTYMSENMDQLTAGDAHKSHVVVGDSNNNVLFLATFKDRDLINVYDGCITYQITRMHNFEHTIFAHCISSNFVGIDSKCEHVFQNLDPVLLHPQIDVFEAPAAKKPAIKQSSITDTFKERKRKNTSCSEISQSKEKKKRESALIEKFKFLKESFGITSKELKKDLHRSAEKIKDLTPTNKTSLNILPKNENVTNNLKNNSNTIIVHDNKINEFDGLNLEEINLDDIDRDEFMDDDKINRILNTIESEISSVPTYTSITCPKSTTVSSVYSNKNATQPNNLKNTSHKIKRKLNNTKSNYNFIDFIEKNNDLSKDESEKELPKKHSGFSDAIKDQVEKYLHKAHVCANMPNTALNALLDNNSHGVDIIESPQAISSDLKHEYQPVIDETLQVNKEKTICTEKTDVKEKSNKDTGLSETIKDHTENFILKTYDCGLPYSPINVLHDNNSRTVEIIENPQAISSDTIQYENDPALYNELGTPQKSNENKYTENKNSYKSIKGDMINENLKDNGKHFNEHSVNTIKNIFYRELFASNKNIASNIGNSIEGDYNIKAPETKLEDNYLVIQKPYKSTYNESLATITDSVGNTDSDIKNFNNKAPFAIEQATTETIPLEQEDPQRSGPKISSNESLSSVTYFSDHLKNEPSFTRNPCDNKHVEFTNIYSYASTKIDVSTNDSPLHRIHVVRKLKIDVNITEVVSEHNEIKTMKEQPTKLNRREPQIEKIYKSPQMDTNNINELKIQFPSAGYQTEKDLERINAMKPYTSLNYIDDFNALKKKYDNNQTEEASITPVVNQIFENNEYERIENTDEICKNKKEEDLVTHKTALEAKNTVENILQKYSYLIRNKSSKDINHVPISNKKEAEENIQIYKPKRPFNICNIGNLTTPLPKTLMIPHTTISTVILPTITNKEQEQNYDSKDSTELMDELNDPNIPKYQLLTDDNCDHIDQTMFDPKTLLQCFTKEDPELIPPPSQFCDETATYSPEYKFEDVSDENFELGDWQENITNCVFDDTCNSQFDLTPSKEIETWTLSQDNLTDNNSYVHHNKSYTVHANTPTNRFGSNTKLSRQSKLGQYKFNQKKKMKM